MKIRYSQKKKIHNSLTLALAASWEFIIILFLNSQQNCCCYLLLPAAVLGSQFENQNKAYMADFLALAVR